MSPVIYVDTSVGIAAGHGRDDRGVGVRIPEGSRIFSTSRPVLRPTQRPTQWGLGVKRLGRETDHSPSLSVEVKNMLIYAFFPPYVFMV
jgi:hypothetical protein